MFTSLKFRISPTIVSLLLAMFLSLHVNAQPTAAVFNRKAYYAAFTDNSIQPIEQQLNKITQSKLEEKDAFEGALMMKKAELIKGASQKLKEFNAGRKKLENVISLHPDNVEFRFLRLMIQEKAPKMLKYDKQLEEDRQYIVQHFRNTSKIVQQAIVDYSKSSKLLSPQDF